MMNRRESLDNRLLQALPPDVLRTFDGQLEVLDMEVRHKVYDPDEPSEYVYFPLSGIISIHKKMRDGVAVEIATIGNEGLVGLEIFLGGEQTPAAAFCQIAGRAARIGADAFRQAVRDSAPLTALLLRYTQAIMTQVAQSAACNRMHSIDERCARWLLMTHDRMDGDRFELTQEFLAEMLGVRRPSVSVAASILQRAGFIRYSRGRVEVVDRAGLESAACECYAVIAREYERLIGGPT
ncbi:MAG: Crp/Fnr family transcriptional regulator [Alphaproteobacteria bacterium]|nr:Crp/Fnr family transcriptional regulator [Alphaproteobacteria bacterium]